MTAGAGFDVKRALAAATALPLAEDIVTSCIPSQPATPDGYQPLTPTEVAFTAAFATSLPQLSPSQRIGLQATAGNIAEAVVEVILADAGWNPLYHEHRPASGGHGVDLLMLTPDLKKVFAIEVKATLQRARWPRLARPHQQQMSPPWLDRISNEGMVDVDLQSADIYGMVSFVHFARRKLKFVVTNDFTTYEPVSSTDDLLDVAQLLRER